MTTQRFEGYPYLVTRIGRTALRHHAVVPADWSREQLVDLAIRQAEANRLDTCLCLGPHDAVYVVPGKAPSTAAALPIGLPLTDRLAIAGPVPESTELLARRVLLRSWVDARRSGGYIVGDGLEGRRTATADDLARLAERGADRLPGGLERCAACGDARGEALVAAVGDPGEPTWDVVTVHCRCANHNRCAGCGGALASRRLSAWFWDDEARHPWYVAAYAGLSHRCPISSRRAS